MLSAALSMFRPLFAVTVVYMLQATEYDVKAYLKWFWRTSDFNKIMYRRTLVRTRAARMLLLVVSVGMAAEIIFAAHLAILAAQNHSVARWFVALAVFLATPIVWAHLVTLPLILGRWLIVKPKYRLEVMKSKSVFSQHPAIKIAVAGSYGKTTMKEILLAVLSEGKKVAATPANKNVAISHANFAKTLKDDEEILIIEYGEGAPGDIAKFAKATKPDIGIITGLAPAHLDKYRTLQKAGQDIFSLANFVEPGKLYVNTDAPEVKPFLKPDFLTFNSVKAAGWTISDIKLSLEGLSFKMKKGSKTLRLRSQLLGKHQVAPLALAAALAESLGLTNQQIEKGVAKVPAFEHRMRPYRLSGAWIIDDTYNGNIEGIKAGLALLKELPAKRKIYITPGLVDQGQDEQKIHLELGRAITKAEPDQVVIIKHSVTDAIVKGLEGYKGQLIIEDDPLEFYTNLDKFVAAGDLVLMQNDWPDNYS